MKVLFIGDLNGYSRTSQRKRAMADLGHEVVALSSVPLGRISGISKRPSLLERALCKIGLPLDMTHINPAILQKVYDTSFDLVWIEKGLTIYPKTLKALKLRRPSTKIASCTEDDMFQRKNQSWYYRIGLKFYDIVFTTKSYNINSGELPALGAQKVVFVDNAFDRYFHYPIDLSKEDKKTFRAEVGFIGTFEAERAQLMFYLAQSGIEVSVFGNGWGKWVDKHPNLKIKNLPIYGEDYIKGICATKINLCFLRKLNRDLQTSRTMEIPACGAFMLAERTAEHCRLFEEGREAAYFDVDKPEELLEKVRFYLENEKERQSVCHAGRERCVTSNYSHHDKVRIMFEKICQL